MSTESSGEPTSGKGPTRPDPDDRLLRGRTVLVTAQRKAAELGGVLRRHGAEVINAPALSVVPHIDDEQLLAATGSLLTAPPDVVVVTTGIGFRGWLEAADQAGLGKELRDVLAAAQLAVRGPKALGAVQAAGLRAEWVAQSETTAELIDLLAGHGVAGSRIAVQHHGAGSDGLDGAMRRSGAEVVPLVVYRWGPPPDPGAIRAGVHLVAQGRVDCVVFTAAPAAAAFLEVADELGVREAVVTACARPGGVLVAAVGSTTAAPLVTAGITPVLPERFRLGALARTIVAELSARPPMSAENQ